MCTGEGSTASVAKLDGLLENSRKESWGRVPNMIIGRQAYKKFSLDVAQQSQSKREVNYTRHSLMSCSRHNRSRFHVVFRLSTSTDHIRQDFEIVATEPCLWGSRF
jgi:hypothetical protein